MPERKSLAERIVDRGPVKAGEVSMLQAPWTTAGDMNRLREQIIRWQRLDAAVAALPTEHAGLAVWMRRHRLGHGAGVGAVMAAVRVDLRRAVEGGSDA